MWGAAVLCVDVHTLAACSLVIVGVGVHSPGWQLYTNRLARTARRMSPPPASADGHADSRLKFRIRRAKSPQRYDVHGGRPLRLWREAHRVQRARLVRVRVTGLGLGLGYGV